MDIKEFEDGTFYNADCMDVLKDIQEKQFDLCLTDPPYGGGCNAGGNGGVFSKYENMTEKIQKNIRDWDFAPEKQTFDEIFRVSKNQIIWGGNYFSLPPTRCFLVWDKLTISEAFSMAMCEYAWTSFNRNAKRYECAPQDSKRFHPTQKPVALIGWCLKLFTNEGESVIDCFSGSGTTAIACHRGKRRFVCIEKDKEYFEMSVKRYEDEIRQGILL